MPCPHLNSISQSVQGRLIYKDQCTRCFVEAKSDTGIFVCLTCFGGFCLGEHTAEHQQVHNHHVYLNIRLFEVEQEIKQTHDKLIIADIPQLEIQTSVVCLSCETDIELDQNLHALVESVKQTDSAFKRAAIAQWEHIPLPCEHTLTIEQNPTAQKGFSTCHNCLLSSNLWLCITCGNIGCGRKNYDGSGGNNHAIDHSKNTGHAVVIKLGTITPEGQGDAYCYSCDTEVVDNFMTEHLALFGIDVQKSVKTEKSIAELNLDANLALQLSKILEEGKLLNPVFGPGLTGIDNIGNSCYMNSVIQVIFSLPEFQQIFATHQNCKGLPINCLICQIVKVQQGLNSGAFSIKKISKSNMDIEGTVKDYYQDGIRLYDFKTIVAKGNNEFLSNRQQDALEYWQILQSFFQKIEKTDKLTPLTKLFEFEQQSVIQCQKCHSYKTNIQKTTDFKIPIEQPTQEQIDKFNQIQFEKYQERLKQLKDGEVAKEFKNDDLPEYNTKFSTSLNILKQGEEVEIFCQQCQSNQIFLKKEYFKNYPKYLVVPVNRFVLQNWVPKKLNANIEIDIEHDFDELRLPNLSHLNQLTDKKQDDFNAEDLAQLVSMGFSENRCKRALLKYKGDTEGAMMYIMETLDDQSQDLPLVQAKVNKKQVSEDYIEQISAMGFTSGQARFALEQTDNNLERAMDYIFSHDLDHEMSQVKQEQQPVDYANQSSKYQLHAAIVHLGVSVHCGHYVSYIQKNGKWYLFNDAKVAESEDPVLGKGYIYVFRRL